MPLPISFPEPALLVTTGTSFDGLIPTDRSVPGGERSNFQIAACDRHAVPIIVRSRIVFFMWCGWLRLNHRLRPGKLVGGPCMNMGSNPHKKQVTQYQYVIVLRLENSKRTNGHGSRMETLR